MNAKSLRANLALSAAVAITGITAPIGLSFILQSLLPITPVQAFAAGAALCSTSLGTTFTVLTTSGLTESRLGVVLTSAAMMDDVAGLVMVQVISNLGDSSSIDAVTIIRPVFVSIAFAVVAFLSCRFIVGPITHRVAHISPESKGKRLSGKMQSPKAMLVCHTGILLALVTGSSYAGTSNLFAAYIAGASISWWDGLSPGLHLQKKQPSNEAGNSTVQKTAPEGDTVRGSGAVNGSIEPDTAPAQTSKAQSKIATTPSDGRTLDHISGKAVYHQYYSPAVTTVLKPFFFASIGFSIPITEMFAGHVVWRGFVYAVLMILGKMLCGLWLVRIGVLPDPRPLLSKTSMRLRGCWPGQHGRRNEKPAAQPHTPEQPHGVNTNTQKAPEPSRQGSHTKRRSQAGRPKSIYPAIILGSAMVARGEIGFLISSVAESRGIFGTGVDGKPSEAFLVVTWAILLCTVLGPLSVGLLVKRTKRLQNLDRSRNNGGRADPLGVWGITTT